MALSVYAFVTAHNFGRHLKALRWQTPGEAVRNEWARNSAPFKANPHPLIPGPYT